MTQPRDPSRARSGVALWIAAALMPLGGGLVALRAVDAAGAGTAALAGVLALGLGARAIRLGQRAAAAALLAGAGLSVAVAGAVAASVLDRMPAASVAAGAVCACAVLAGAGWCLPAAPGAVRTLATATGVVTVASTVAAAAVALGLPLDHLARLLPVLVVLALGPLARGCVGAGGLAEAALRLRLTGRVGRSELDELLRRAGEQLRGVLIGLAIVVGVCVGGLVGFGPAVDLGLGLGFGLLLWLRSRLFDRLGQVLPLRLAALVAPLAAVVRLLAEAPVWAPAIALLALAGLAWLVTTGVGGRRWRGRWLWFGELTTVGAAAVVAVTQG